MCVCERDRERDRERDPTLQGSLDQALDQAGHTPSFRCRKKCSDVLTTTICFGVGLSQVHYSLQPTAGVDPGLIQGGPREWVQG